MRYDAIVVGAGPAGGMAAYTLASGNARVLVLEAARLPRLKPCGGGLTPVAASTVPWDISRIVERRVNHAVWRLNEDRIVHASAGVPMFMVDRARFDLHIVERAVNRGAELRDGTAVDAVLEGEAGVVVTTKAGERFHAAYVVGADGALGRTARSVGLGRRVPLAGAVDAEVVVDPDVLAREADRMTIDFGATRNGYAWIFPKCDSLSCGIGSWRGRARLPEQLDAFLVRSLPSERIVCQKRYGHPIPLWAGRRPLATARVCLVGDAASLVDPVMGEGIRYALQSGRLAGEVVLALLGGGDVDGVKPRDCTTYDALVARRIGAELEALRAIVQPILLKDPGFFFRQFYEEGRRYLALARALSARSAARAAT